MRSRYKDAAYFDRSSWAEEKNGPIRPLAPRPVIFLSETLIGCSVCSDCDAVDPRECRCCMACGEVQPSRDELSDERECPRCYVARMAGDEPDTVNSLGMSGLVTP